MTPPIRRRTTMLRMLPLAALWACGADTDGPVAPTSGAIDAAPRTEEIGSSLDALVMDAFGRSVIDGWGMADAGGAWHIDTGRQPDFQVNGSEGVIVKWDNGPRNVVASEGYGHDVFGLASFSMDVAPDNAGRFYTVQVYARRDDRMSDGDNYYRYRVRAYGKGAMEVRLEKNVSGTRSWLTENQAIATTWEPGQRYWVRWECSGASPSTTLRMRVWRDGEAEPTGWDAEAVIDEPALDVEGTTGFRVEGPNGSEQVTYPVVFRFDDLAYGTPSENPPSEDPPSEEPPPEEPAPNGAPAADAGGPYAGVAGSEVRFDGSASADPDGDAPLTYEWTFGDGASGLGVAPAHTYAAAGSYAVTLTVTDSLGAVSEPSTTMAVIDAPAPSGVLVLDAFSRTTTDGWGDADIGGPWRIDLQHQPDFRVNGSEGSIVKWDNGPRNAVVSEGYGMEVEGLAAFRIDVAPDHRSRFYTVQVYARRGGPNGADNSYYRYRVRAFGNGKMDARLEMSVAGTRTWLGTGRPISSTWVPGERYWIRWECSGTSPSTTVRMRVWRDGDPEPTGWDAEVTADEPALDIEGTTGFRVEGPNGGEQVTFPITFGFDNLEYRVIQR